MTREHEGTPALPRRLTGGSPKGAQLREILEGLVTQLAPGSALPSERDLAERYGVARMTVRGEIDRLTADGLTYRLQGRGTFVSEPRVAQAMSFSSFSEDMRARGLEPSSRVVGQEQVEAGEFLSSRLQLAPGAPVIRVDRLRLADGDPLAVEQASIPLERFPEAAEANFAQVSLFELLQDHWGARLADADQRVLAVGIDGDEAEHLGVSEGHPGLRFQTLARDDDGVPVYYAVSLFRGDKYEIDLRQVRAHEHGEQP
jgi:GntR family transcriptional regulator